jgi:phospholipid/cholesterol/gamma-HCH transport system ATP-binding protein
MKIISVKNLKAGYGKEVVLQDINLEVESGEIRIILGESGCGRSTLLNNIIGLEQPLAGTISILNREVTANLEAFSMELKKQMGVLFQSSALLTSMTVAENVALPLKIHNPDLPESVVEEAVRFKLSQVYLGPAYDKYPSELSGGMRKRAALARAMISDPTILFCDEPSAGLDPLTSKSLDELLLELRKKLGLTIVVVTHELESIRNICDKLTFLAEGNVIFDGTLSEALTSSPERVRQFFAREGGKESGSSMTLSFNLEG